MNASVNLDAGEPRSGGGSDRAAGGASVELVDATGRVAPADLAWLTEMAGRALGELAGAGHLSAKVVGDSAMAEAHERFSGVGGTTDVLTFDLRASEREALCVDVLVCLDQAERAARARGLAVRSELLLYLVHAMLHCLGHDDHDEAASAAMHAAEDRLLTGLGVGPVYGVNEGGRGA